MSAFLTRASGLAARRNFGGYGTTQRRTASSAEVAQDTSKKAEVLKKGARRDPELYVRL